MGGERFNQEVRKISKTGWEHLMTYLWRYAGIYERGQWAFLPDRLTQVLGERYKEGQECLIVNEKDTELKGR